MNDEPREGGGGGPVREAARLAHAAGLSIVPPREDGTKAPIESWRDYQTTRAGPDQVEAWYRNGRRGLGAVMGAVSGGVESGGGEVAGGTETFEFDDAATYRLFKSRAARPAVGLGEPVERIEAGYCEESPSGGVHWIYRCSVVAGNTKLAQRPDPAGKGSSPRKTLIETRGEGGYVVLAPSCGPVHPSGRPYRLLKGSAATIAVITPEERAELWELARSFDEMPAVEPGRATKPGKKGRASDLDEIKPGEAFEAAVEWSEILEPEGWAQLHTAGEVTYWRRPGKSRGISATTGRGGKDCFYCFSSSTAFEMERPYTKFGAYALLHHGGDHSAAARALRAEGFGSTAGGRKSGGPDGPAPPLAEAGGEPDDRPVILVTAEVDQVITQAVEAIAADPSLYQRGNTLATVLQGASIGEAIDRPAGSPRIAPMPIPTLRGTLTRNARWLRLKKGQELQVVPPDWAVQGVACRGEWPGVRVLEAIVETPTLRPDGTVLDTPGYDPATGLIYSPNATYRPVPRKPGIEEARRAAGELLSLVIDFPFKGDADRAGWLAGLLTPPARFAIDGPCPLFFLDANAPGSGKSLLADIIATVATGRGMPRTAYPEADDEMRKRITSIALAGDRLMLIDNVAGIFGGPAIDAALTGTSWRDRNLGRLEMTPDLPLFTIWYATANNAEFRGDILRRIQRCRLETDEERPEERGGFSIAGDLLAHVRKHRPALVAAALTILRAHAVAGRPSQGLSPLGSYESWSTVVRAAVHWTTGIDPCATREELRASDPAAQGRRALVEGWAELPRGLIGLTCAEALRILDDPKHSDEFTSLRDLMLEWSRNGKLPSARSVGMRLNAIKGRNLNGWKFVVGDVSHQTSSWKVVRVEGGTDGTRGTTSNASREKHQLQVSDSESTGEGRRQSPESPRSPFVVKATDLSPSPHMPDGSREVGEI